MGMFDFLADLAGMASGFGAGEEAVSGLLPVASGFGAGEEALSGILDAVGATQGLQALSGDGVSALADAFRTASAGGGGPVQFLPSAEAAPGAGAGVVPSTFGTPTVSAPASVSPAGMVGPTAAVNPIMSGQTVSPGTGPTMPTPGGGGVTEFVKSLLPYMKPAGTAVGGAASLMGAINAAQANKIAKQANELRMNVAQPAADFARTQLAAAGTGKLTPAQQAQVDTWKSQAKQRIDQYLAKSGTLNSTMQQQWYDWIDQQALAMSQDLLTQTAQLGIQATGAAAGAAPAGIAPQTYQDALKSAQETLGQLATV